MVVAQSGARTGVGSRDEKRKNSEAPETTSLTLKNEQKCDECDENKEETNVVQGALPLLRSQTEPQGERCEFKTEKLALPPLSVLLTLSLLNSPFPPGGPPSQPTNRWRPFPVPRPHPPSPGPLPPPSHPFQIFLLLFHFFKYMPVPTHHPDPPGPPPTGPLAARSFHPSRPAPSAPAHPALLRNISPNLHEIYSKSTSTISL